MKTLKLILLFACLITYSSVLKAQEDYKPKPIKNETLEMLMGTWKSDPYEIMGGTRTETAVHSMVHNGQYMNIEVTGTDDMNHTYSASIYIACDKDGNLTGWVFDDFGGIKTLTGKTDKNKITANGTSPNGSDTRTIEINGNTMVQNITFNYKDKNGKENSTKVTVTFHKQ